MSVLSKRYRGFKVVNLVGLGLLITLVLGVYLAKTIAWRERNEIAAVEQQIRAEKLRIRLLQAEVAHLEQPRRIQALSSQALGLKAIGPKQEIAAADLQRFARPAPKIEAETAPAGPALAQAQPQPQPQPASDQPAVLPVAVARPATGIRVIEQ